MKKAAKAKFKRIGFLSASIVGAWLLSAAIAPFFFDGARWSRKIESVFNGKGFGELQVGSGRLSLWLGPRVVFEDLEWKTPEGEIWFAAPRMEVRVSLWSLIRARPRSELHFADPQIRLGSHEIEWLKNAYFEHQAKAAENPSEPASLSMRLPAFLARARWGIRLHSASIVVRKAEDVRHAFNNLDITLDGINSQEPLNGRLESDLSFRSGSKFVLEGPLSISAKLDRPSPDSLKLPVWAEMDCTKLSFVLTDWVVKRAQEYCHADVRAEVSKDQTFLDRLLVRYRSTKLEVTGSYTASAPSDSSNGIRTNATLEAPSLEELFESFPVFDENKVSGRLTLKASADGVLDAVRLKASWELNDFKFYSNEGDDALKWRVLGSFSNGQVDSLEVEESGTGFRASGALTSIFPLKGRFLTDSPVDSEPEKFVAPMRWLGHQLHSVERRFSNIFGEFKLVKGKKEILFREGRWVSEPFAARAQSSDDGE